MNSKKKPLWIVTKNEKFEIDENEEDENGKKGIFPF